jgi:hypothetical protein
MGTGALVIALDYLSGLDTLLPALPILPVILAAWYSGRNATVILAVALPLAHILILVARWTPPEPLAGSIMLTCVRGAFILVMGLWFVRLSQHERTLRQRVRTLEGLLPICSFCKNIRNEAGEWERLETYITSRSGAEFSHSFCPSCGKRHYGDDA